MASSKKGLFDEGVEVSELFSKEALFKKVQVEAHSANLHLHNAIIGSLDRRAQRDPKGENRYMLSGFKSTPLTTDEVKALINDPEGIGKQTLILPMNRSKISTDKKNTPRSDQEM